MFEEPVEAKIQEVMRNGEFDTLPFGKPVFIFPFAKGILRHGLLLP